MLTLLQNLFTCRTVLLKPLTSTSPPSIFRLQFASRLPQPHPSPLLHQLHPHLHHLQQYFTGRRGSNQIPLLQKHRKTTHIRPTSSAFPLLLCLRHHNVSVLRCWVMLITCSRPSSRWRSFWRWRSRWLKRTWLKQQRLEDVNVFFLFCFFSPVFLVLRWRFMERFSTPAPSAETPSTSWTCWWSVCLWPPSSCSE